MTLPVTPADVAAAERRIRPFIRRTPLMAIDGAPLGCDAPVSLKLEFLQHAGSFKPRGAFANLVGATVPPAGVTTASGGNHGAATAYAAARLGLKARIFVPAIASPAKIAAIRGFGADVVVEGARYADALALCEAYARDSGALALHAYDSRPTIAGQGTVGLEWQQDLAAAGAGIDTLLVAVGGGGLIAGIAAWFAGRVRVIGVEPAGSRALHAALQAGRPVDVEIDSVAADSLGARSAGGLVVDIARAHVHSVGLGEDSPLGAAQKRLWRELRVAAEPGGAAAFAALAGGAFRPQKGERVGVLLCGANVDLDKLAALVG
ncbi:MAG: serine/threonine dehydratase [Methylobacteriaceae bacterium]|nr:serine/threonine dehydratase [Methylobacteriaceae bacterium]